MKHIVFRISAFAATWAFCFAVYLALAWSCSTQELILGALTAFIVALFSSRFMIRRNPAHLLHPRRLVYLIAYLFVLFPLELIRANWRMARRAFSRKIHLNPGIVRVPTAMRSDYGLMLLANAITLTPGTLSMEIAQDEDGQNYYYIHWIDIAADNEADCSDMIKGRLEKWLRRIWE